MTYGQILALLLGLMLNASPVSILDWLIELLG